MDTGSLNLRISKGFKMENYTYKEIANNYELWCEYVDPDGVITNEEFYEMTIEEKVKIQQDCFGDEE